MTIYFTLSTRLFASALVLVLLGLAWIAINGDSGSVRGAILKVGTAHKLMFGAALLQLLILPVFLNSVFATLLASGAVEAARQSFWHSVHGIYGAALVLQTALFGLWIARA
ncbi:hypothetical protein CAI21_16580 [Alkalilimnicola ehrlichii]|uniref:Uncharacterized protein n=1 Tax=Alkalilimnicola ehrlichii TaxID=351052 RepID=A0A3E0WLF2_9GAMM|nr:hypothetical protein [Alkalilimnicola ehrlichii]RFA26581.1 hypothetical protein CAI21_16580 [Alkalilimnicola ehrlichii]RFA32917.1 hypothetical protein CAL65_18415 [Alkalilimnicola ehrlichii]